MLANIPVVDALTDLRQKLAGLLFWATLLDVLGLSYYNTDRLLKYSSLLGTKIDESLLL